MGQRLCGQDVGPCAPPPTAHGPEWLESWRLQTWAPWPEAAAVLRSLVWGWGSGVSVGRRARGPARLARSSLGSGWSLGSCGQPRSPTRLAACGWRGWSAGSRGRSRTSPWRKRQLGTSIVCSCVSSAKNKSTFSSRVTGRFLAARGCGAAVPVALVPDFSRRAALPGRPGRRSHGEASLGQGRASSEQLLRPQGAPHPPHPPPGTSPK